MTGPSSYQYFPDFHMTEKNNVVELKVEIDSWVWPILLHRYFSGFCSCLSTAAHKAKAPLIF